jgi:hypothetical protein
MRCSRWQRSPFDLSKTHSRRAVVQELHTGLIERLMHFGGVAAGMYFSIRVMVIGVKRICSGVFNVYNSVDTGASAVLRITVRELAKLVEVSGCCATKSMDVDSSQQKNVMLRRTRAAGRRSRARAAARLVEIRSAAMAMEEPLADARRLVITTMRATRSMPSPGRRPRRSSR